MANPLYAAGGSLLWVLIGLMPASGTDQTPIETVSVPLVPENLAQEPPETGVAADLNPLNPDPNLLTLPDAPSEVTIETTQSLTLEQVLELAQRNNRDLQVTQLLLQESQAALRSSQALNWPTLNWTASVSRTDAASFQPNLSATDVRSELLSGVTQQVQQQLQQQRLQSQQQLQQQLQQVQLSLQFSPVEQTGVTLQLGQLQIPTPNLPSVFSVSNLSATRALLNQSQGLTGGGGSSFNSSVALNYNIFTSGSRSATIRAAERQVALAEIEVINQRQQLRLDATNDYYNLQNAIALIEVATAAVANAQQSLQDARAREQAGLGTRLDVLQAQVQLANATQILTQANTVRVVAQRQLAQRLSLSPTTNITAAEAVAVAGDWPLSLEDSIISALQNRGELTQALLQRDISEQLRQVALAANRPRIQAFASFNVLDNLEDQVLGDYGYSVGLQVVMNFFDGGAARNRARQQEQNIQIAEEQFANLKNQIRLQVERAYYDLQANFSNIATSAQAVEQAREGLRLARLRFQAGVGTQLEVIRAQDELTRAEGNQIEAILNYNRALAALQRATSIPEMSAP